jgi:hypothetical protein
VIGKAGRASARDHPTSVASPYLKAQIHVPLFQHLRMVADLAFKFLQIARLISLYHHNFEHFSTVCPAAADDWATDVSFLHHNVRMITASNDQRTPVPPL